MQLAIFDLDLTKNVKMHPDRWVTKLSIEAAQLVATAYSDAEIAVAPKTKSGRVRSNKSHPHHPLTKWTNVAYANWRFVVLYGLALNQEKLVRYPKNGLPHHNTFLQWCLANPPQRSWPSKKATKFWVPKAYLCDGSVPASFRAYFLAEKQHLAQWTNRPIPEWYKSHVA